MKKIIVAILVVCMAIFAFASCGEEEIKSYTVTFDTDGGTTVAAQTVEEGKLATQPADPTKEGCTFTGWTVNGAEFNFTKGITADVTVKATWAVNDYTVTFDTDGGSEIKPVSVPFGTPVKAPTAPTKDGYTFAGWFVGEAAYDFTKPVMENVTVKAAWTLNDYTVDFDTDGGTAVESVGVSHGATVTKPDDPTKDGYIFEGWFIGEEAYDFDAPVTSDITIKAVWTLITYEVTYDTDGAEPIEGETVNYGGTATKPADPIKDGYYFMGWTVDGAAYDFEAVLTGDITLKAEWLEIPDLTAIAGTWTGSESVVYMTNTYEFVIKADGTVTASYNNGYTDVVMTINYVKLDGNTFTVNYTAGSTEGADMVFTVSDDKGSLTTASAAGTYALTLYKTLTVTFDWGNYKSEVDPTVKTVKYGDTVAAPSKSWTGYEIKYWLNGEEQFNFETPITSDMTLVAHWDVKMINVTFVGQDGTTPVATVTVAYNTAFGELVTPDTIPTTDGYKFNGHWYSSITGTSPVSATSKITSEKTYYPGLIAPMTDIDGKWVGTDSKGTTYTMVVNAEEQTVAITTVNGETTEELNIKSILFKLFATSTPATKLVVRYIPTGATSETTLTLTYTENKTFTGSNSLTLEKEIVGVPTYTVTINADNGTEPTTETVAEGATATKPADPTKDGFTFAGWFVDDVAYDFTAAVTGDITVVAKWTEVVVVEEFTVTFNLDGGKLTGLVTEQTVASGSTVAKPETDPTKNNYDFVGWFVGDVEYDFTKAVTADITITAKWKGAMKKLVFVKQDGSKFEFTEAEYGKTLEQVITENYAAIMAGVKGVDASTVVVPVTFAEMEAELVNALCTIPGSYFGGMWTKGNSSTTVANFSDTISSASYNLSPNFIDPIIETLSGTWSCVYSGKTYDFTVTFTKDGEGNITDVDVAAKVDGVEQEILFAKTYTSSGAVQFVIRYQKSATSAASFTIKQKITDASTGAYEWQYSSQTLTAKE